MYFILIAFVLSLGIKQHDETHLAPVLAPLAIREGTASRVPQRGMVYMVGLYFVQRLQLVLRIFIPHHSERELEAISLCTLSEFSISQFWYPSG